MKEGTEIARELGVTRQAVSNTLKRAMSKFYKEVKKMDKDMDPFEVSCSMLHMLGVGNNVEDIRKFYNLFPPDIRNEIETCALEKHCSKGLREKMEKK
jgi:predicted DNA-binding protein YlxM (UPF0122 family)